MYEPYADALAEYLRMALPPWLPSAGGFDSWQTSAWERIAPEQVANAVGAPRPDDHF